MKIRIIFFLAVLGLIAPTPLLATAPPISSVKNETDMDQKKKQIIKYVLGIGAGVTAGGIGLLGLRYALQKMYINKFKSDGIEYLVNEILRHKGISTSDALYAQKVQEVKSHIKSTIKKDWCVVLTYNEPGEKTDGKYEGRSSFTTAHWGNGRLDWKVPKKYLK
jgi:hypothetical protein